LNSIGNQIKQRRLALRLTLRAAGRRLGVTHATLIGWEARGRLPQARHQAKLTAFFGGVASTTD